jgi:hypothetical protein
MSRCWLPAMTCVLGKVGLLLSRGCVHRYHWELFPLGVSSFWPAAARPPGSVHTSPLPHSPRPGGYLEAEMWQLLHLCPRQWRCTELWCVYSSTRQRAGICDPRVADIIYRWSKYACIFINTHLGLSRRWTWGCRHYLMYTYSSWPVPLGKVRERGGESHVHCLATLFQSETLPPSLDICIRSSMSAESQWYWWHLAPSPPCLFGHLIIDCIREQVGLCECEQCP